MPHSSRWVVGALVTAGLGLAGCTAQGGATAPGDSPARVTAVAGTTALRVTLTERANERLDIRTAVLGESTVTPPEGGPSAVRKTAPYSALIYDVDGKTWVFAMTEPRSYLRQEVVVDFVDGETAALTSGPAAGTEIVTVGAAALYGTELGVGDDAE